MENGEWNGVGLGLDTCPLKDKTTATIEKIVQEAEKPRRKTVNLGRGDARLPGPFSRYSERRVLVHVWSTCFALDHSYWAYWASFC